MQFKKQIGDRIALTDFPEYGDASRVHITIRNGWNASCDWKVNEIGLEEARDLHYALGRLIAHADQS
jgi:hypothetical protein